MSIKTLVVSFVILIVIIFICVHAITVRNSGKEVVQKYYDRQAETITYIFNK